MSDGRVFHSDTDGPTSDRETSRAEADSSGPRYYQVNVGGDVLTLPKLERLLTR